MDDIRVLIVDDQEPFRVAMATIVEETDGFVVVGSVTSAEEALVAEGDVNRRVMAVLAYLDAATGSK